MAKNINTKNLNTAKTSQSANPVAEVKTTNDAKTLTVVVQDDKSQPTAGANVSIKPSDASLVTNASGEVQFKLGTDTKYEITASYGRNTVTVPYYVTKDGATRLIVNPTYVKEVERQLHPSVLSVKFISTVGASLGIIIIFFVVWKYLGRRKNRKINKEE